jgi:hypothetical protein
MTGLVFLFKIFVFVMVALAVNRGLRLSIAFLDRLEKLLDEWASVLSHRFRLYAPVARTGFYLVAAALLVNRYAELDLPLLTPLGAWVRETFLSHDLADVGAIATTVGQGVVAVLFLVAVNRYAALDIGPLNRIDRALDRLGEFVSFRMGNVQSLAGKGTLLLAMAVLVNGWAGFDLPILNQIEAAARSAFDTAGSPSSVEESVGRVRGACEKEQEALRTRIHMLDRRIAALQLQGNDGEAFDLQRRSDLLASERRDCD